jgi:3-oxoacyl-[acyl-carrier protein] reductase
MIDFGERVVLVTGAAGAIGAATARTIARYGGRVVLHDLRFEGGLTELRNELEERAHAVVADLSDPQSARDLWQQAVAWRGRIDALVNNAGIYEPASVEDDLRTWTAAWDRMLAICLVSPATLCREAILTFSEQEQGGTIINLSSRAALPRSRPWRRRPPSCAHGHARRRPARARFPRRPPRLLGSCSRARRGDVVRVPTRGVGTASPCRSY